MSKQNILVTGADLAPEAQAILQDFQLHYAGARPTETDLIELCKSLDPIAMIVRYGKISENVINASNQLKVISKHGSGIDNIDQSTAAQRKIKVVAATAVNAISVAEHALALLLASSKSVPLLNERMHQGHWDKATHKNIELSGKTVGLIGFGAIGRHFAKILTAMGMHILAYDPFTTNFPDYVHNTSLETLLAQSDVISLHCPLTEQTKEIINKHSLSLCKSGAILINTARGGLIQEQDLLDALASNTISIAALDSFAVEPIPQDHLFLGHPRIILSPHIGGVTQEAYTHMGVAAAKNILQNL